MKTFRLLLILASCLAISAAATAAESKTFRAGAAQVDITPTSFP